MTEPINTNETDWSKVDAPQEVKDVYKRVKRDLIDDPDRKTWERIRKRCWDAAYPLDPDPNEGDSIWTQKEREAMIAKGQIPVQVNDLARDIQGASALITSKSPDLNFLPIGSGDLYVAELLKRGWNCVINGNDASIIFYDFIKEKNIGNLAVIEAKHDPSLGIFGKIVLGDVDPTTYYFEKKSKKRDHSDVSFGKAHQVTKKYALETYEDLTDEDLIFSELKKEETASNVPDGKTGQDNYAVETNDKIEDTNKEPENVWEIEDWEFVKEKEIWVMLPDETKPYGYVRDIYKNYDEITKAGWVLSEDKKTATDVIGAQALVWKRLVTKRVQRIIVGKKLISKTVNPLGIDAEGAPVLPIITLLEDKTLNGYPTGKTARALELNRAANKRRMQSILVASKNIETTKVMPIGAKWILDEKHGDWIEVSKDAAFQPTQMGPVNTSGELLNLMQVDTQNIHDEYQINDIIQGKIPPGQSNMAHRTVLSLTEMVGVISSPGVVAFESSLVRLGKAVVALMLMVCPRQWWARLIEPDEIGTWVPDKLKKQVDEQGQPIQPEPSVIETKWKDALDRLTGEGGKPKTDLIDIDVKIVAGSTQPTNRMAKAGVALEMKHEGVYDTKAVLDYTDDPKKDEIAERMEKQRQEELQAIAQGQAAKGSKAA